MKLYYKPGACSLAPHIALRFAGVDFDLEKVDTKTKITESGADYLAVTPKGYVPALRLEDDDVLTEAPAILQLIADRNPGANLVPPAGTVGRARVQEHLNFVSSELHKAYSPFFGDEELTGEAREKAETGVAKRLDLYNGILSDGRTYLTGDIFTVADAYFFVVVNWSNFIGIDVKKWPNVAAYMERTNGLAPIQEALKAEGLLN